MHDIVSSFPVSKFDTAGEARDERIASISSDIDAAGRNATEKAFLLMTADKESKLAQFVDLDEEKCWSPQTEWCDFGRAYSMWQLHNMTREESREESARKAARVFVSHANFCLKQGFTYVQGGISMYATGTRCTWEQSKERAKEMKEIEKVLCR